MSRFTIRFAVPAAAVALAACGDGASSPVAPAEAPLSQRGRVSAGMVDPPSVGVGVAGLPVAFPLYAGGGNPNPGGTGTLVGQVLVWNVGTTQLRIEYRMLAGYCMTEAHFSVLADIDGLASGGNGGPAPGQLDHAWSGGCASGWGKTVSVPAGDPSQVAVLAHAVTRGSSSTNTSVPAATYVSGAGNAWPVFVTQRRNGNVAGLTDLLAPKAVVNAWQPEIGVPGPGSYWNAAATGIGGDPNGQWLITNGGTWVWETFRTNVGLLPNGAESPADPMRPKNGAVVRMEATLFAPVAAMGTFRITCDNGYRVFRGTNPGSTLARVDEGPGVDATPADRGNQLSATFDPAATTDLRQATVRWGGWQSVESYSFSLQPGLNRVVIWGVNERMYAADPLGADIQDNGGQSEGDENLNPAGCIFGLAVPAGNSTSRMGNETAWGAAPSFNGSETEPGNVVGDNWATYFVYRRR